MTTINPKFNEIEKMKRTLFWLVLASIALTPAAFAAVSDEEFAELREQLEAISARLEELAAENAELRDSGPAICLRKS